MDMRPTPSHVDQRAHRSHRRWRHGPTRGVIRWRTFIVETVLIVVLVAVIVAIGFGASGGLLAKTMILALVAAILRIIWRPRDP
jgi:hypothetical protein